MPVPPVIESGSGEQSQARPDQGIAQPPAAPAPAPAPVAPDLPVGNGDAAGGDDPTGGHGPRRGPIRNLLDELR